MFQTVNPEERAAPSLHRSAVWPPSVIFTVLFLGFLREKFPRPVVLPRASVFPQALSRHDLIRLHTVPLWPTQCLCFSGLKRKEGEGRSDHEVIQVDRRSIQRQQCGYGRQTLSITLCNTLHLRVLLTVFPMCSTTDFIFKRTNTARNFWNFMLHLRLEWSNLAQ